MRTNQWGYCNIALKHKSWSGKKPEGRHRDWVGIIFGSLQFTVDPAPSSVRHITVAGVTTEQLVYDIANFTGAQNNCATSCSPETLGSSKSLSLLSFAYNMFWYVLKTVLTFTSCVEVHLCLLLLFPCLLSSVFLLLRLPHCVLASYLGHLANSLNTRCSYPDCSTCT